MKHIINKNDGILNWFLKMFKLITKIINFLNLFLALSLHRNLKSIRLIYLPFFRDNGKWQESGRSCGWGVCKKVVAAFTFSWKKKRGMVLAQEQHHLHEHKLVTESPTRWGSHQRIMVLTWQAMDLMESMHEALNPLLEFTDSLSGESCECIHLNRCCTFSEHRSWRHLKLKHNSQRT